MRRGEVRWYRYAAPDERRPLVILIRGSVLEYLGEVTIAPVTSTFRVIPSEVEPSSRDGLPRGCAVNLDHVQSIAKNRIGALVTTLSPSA